MLLNRLEKALMNNPVRAAIQRHVEARRLVALGGRLAGGTALEVGCGRGAGVELVLDVFGAQRAVAFDLDPDMVEQARRRLRGRGDRVSLSVGDVTRIAAADGAYDAVFDFGILHHVPDWRAGLREIHRVLRPGGRFFAEEVCAGLLRNPVVSRLLVHPAEGVFTHGQFVSAVREAGFSIRGTSRLGPWFDWVVADRAA